jgi:hypothetical protein
MRSYKLASAVAVRTGSLYQIRNQFFEDPVVGGTEGGDENGDKGGNEEPPAPAAAATKTGKLFTQDEVNRMIKNDKDKSRRERDDYLNELTKLRDQGITGENLDALNKRIEQLTNEGKTKEQLAKEAADKSNKAWQKKLSDAEAIGAKWKGEYETYRKQTEIFSAATANKAYNPEQVYQIIRGSTSLVDETTEDGKPTGKLVARVKLTDVDKDGKPVDLDLSVSEAVKRMTEMPVHANLFASAASGGLGGGNHNRNGSGGNTIPTDMEAYMKCRGKGGENVKNANARS